MVKRWTLGIDFQGGSPEAEADDGECFYPRQTKFVLASDYDALKARIRDLLEENVYQKARIETLAVAHDALAARIRELEESLAKYQACRVHDVDEKAYLSKRVTELEAAIQWALDSGDVFYPKDVGDRLRDVLSSSPRRPVYGLNCGAAQASVLAASQSDAGGVE